MILNNAPQNEAVLSNVSEIGEFRIRNSAKAFNILSSGLYANKIKAIIRELSCNAVDSHVAAGVDKPFDVHLPSNLAPYFYIRDYGTGLSHDQVTNIYTTYFESTKTASNDFIGALGLGSKSPFSYTDNFTVTAIQNGRRGVYTAFINEAGVPSIALLSEEQTDEPNGVEVRFGIESTNDFFKFAEESRNVYKWFKVKPNFVGADPEVKEVAYETKDIVPGVHVIDSHRGRHSYAVMGNIAYPIEVPNADKVLGELNGLLSCNLVIEFGIGEVDFQASREGLSYIPQTIESIKKKLETLNGRLVSFVEEEADKIENKWERAHYLVAKRSSRLFSPAVQQYLIKSNFELVDPRQYYGARTQYVSVESAAAEFNIQLRSFSYNSIVKKCHTQEIKSHHFDGDVDSDGRKVYKQVYAIPVISNAYFVENDTKIGVTERAKYHWRTDDNTKTNDQVFVIEPVDKTKPMKLEEFFKSIHNPPTKQIMKASTLRQKDRVKGSGMGKNVTILRIEERGGRTWHSSSNDLVWRDAGTVDGFDDKETYYYIPLSGFVPQWKKLPQWTSCSEIVKTIANSRIPAVYNITVYGVRKGDIEDIQKRSNWVNLEDHLFKVMASLDDKLVLGAIREQLDKYGIMQYNIDHIAKNLNDGPALDFLKEFVGVPRSNNFRSLQHLVSIFNKDKDLKKLVNEYEKRLREFSLRYPLIKKLDHSATDDDVVSYINLVDSVKTV